MSEFNLGEKRKELLKHTIDAVEVNAITVEDIFIQIGKQDKEFINRLFEKRRKEKGDKYGQEVIEVEDLINLSGEMLFFGKKLGAIKK